MSAATKQRTATTFTDMSATVPPGYKRSEVGVVPKDWVCDRLGKHCERITKGTTPTSVGRPFAASGVHFLKAEAIAEDGKTIPGKIAFIDASTHMLLARSQLAAGDVLISIAGVLGRVGRVCENDLPANTNQALAIVRVSRDSILGRDYLFWCLHSDIVAKQIRDINVQAAQANISLQNVRDFILPLPTAPEQRAIAGALSDVDGLLGALEALIAKKWAIKQAAMQQLLTGRTRLPGFNGPWETKRLGEIAVIEMGRTPSRSNAALWGVGHVWLSIADLHGKVVSESKEQITDLAASSMTPVPEGTLLMSFKLSIGRLCFAGCDLFTNEAICSFAQVQADANYLYYALSRTDFSVYGKQAVKGYTLNSESLRVVEVVLPERSEQTAIATVLSDMDAEIAALERRRDKTRVIKQGMMQQLLTGRVRLVAPEVAA